MRSSAIVPVNLTGVSPVGQYRLTEQRERDRERVDLSLSLSDRVTHSDEELVAQAAAAALGTLSTTVRRPTGAEEGDRLLGKMERRAAERRRRRAALADHYAAKEQQKAAEAEAASVVSAEREREQKAALRTQRRLRRLKEVAAEASKEGRRRHLVAAKATAHRQYGRNLLLRAWREWHACIRRTFGQIARVAMARAHGISRAAIRAWKCAARAARMDRAAVAAAARGARLRLRRDVQTRRAWNSFVTAVADAASVMLRRATLQRRATMCAELLRAWQRFTSQERAWCELRTSTLRTQVTRRRLVCAMLQWKGWCKAERNARAVAATKAELASKVAQWLPSTL